MSVTHLPRHIKARSVFAATDSVDEVAKQLGHNGLRSAKYYLDAEPKKVLSQRNILENPHGSVENLIVTKKGIIYIAND